MNPIFGRGPSLQLRLFFAVLLSASLMLADSRLDTFANVRYVLNSTVAPIQYLADLPRTMFGELYERFSSKQQLLTTNKALRDELLKQKSELSLLSQYKEENQRFRKLLGSSFIRDEKKVVTEVMSVDSSSYHQQIVIDKGRTDGVYQGQPVINESGIVGQVTEVGAHNSRVLLLTDANSAIPVQVIRNDIRVIAAGSGNVMQMHLQHIPSNFDIQQGDVLVSSGLGDVYPEGYPVATVNKVQIDNHQEFSTIIATPAVDFGRLRYLLLVWPQQSKQELPAITEPPVQPEQPAIEVDDE
ncbi:rod shape-determining protein MreC [Vibrio sp. UCD-FRSSP16_10]|uniref:rod shape-determining protein MreC n=1 Tax=unclassified Vibrio TaxID=2614977 RepID=UPI0007FC150A|nr:MULTISPECIES: rod shape-determining protein MreC [unclassified Vibrio]OBT17435.1 rod shape-determining protein MreC [Vibrio sp. UCD-FRSSP16_30]OBT23204.1 rod shape-determining protein MreC [Vibrio sp. UCD-FRSSP16_10]